MIVTSCGEVKIDFFDEINEIKTENYEKKWDLVPTWRPNNNPHCRKNIWVDFYLIGQAKEKGSSNFSPPLVHNQAVEPFYIQTEAQLEPIS